MSGKSQAGVVTSEGSASGIQKSVGTAPLVQPATGTSEVDQVVEIKELGNVAKAIENFWDEFAVELDPVLFQATGKIQAIKNTKDFSTPIMQAQAMLEMWRDAKDKDATRRLLIKTLCKMGKVKQSNDIFGEILTGSVWQHKTDVIDGPLPPDKQTESEMVRPRPDRPFLGDNGWKYDVFLLHAGQNKPFVENLYWELCSKDVLPFFDKYSLPTGTKAQDVIMEALQTTSRFVVPVLSHEIKDESYPEDEMKEAVDRFHRFKESGAQSPPVLIVPVFYLTTLDECRKSTNQFVKDMSTFTGIPRQGDDEDAYLRTVAEEITKMVKRDDIKFQDVVEALENMTAKGSSRQPQPLGPKPDQGGVAVQQKEKSMYEIMKNLVVDHGMNQWSSFGHAFHFNGAKINTITANKPTEAGKLEALIEELKIEKTEDKAAELLVQSCGHVPHHITGIVKDELKKQGHSQAIEQLLQLFNFFYKA